jgi:DNA-binding phage protein
MKITRFDVVANLSNVAVIRNYLSDAIKNGSKADLIAACRDVTRSTTDVTQADIDAFCASLERHSTPWASGLRSLILKIWGPR